MELFPAAITSIVDLTAGGITVKVFPTSSDDDTISWQENTKGQMMLCYRDGRVYLSHLEYWQVYAVKTAQSTFASTTETWEAGSFTPTASYTLRWQDLPQQLLVNASRISNEDVVQVLTTATTAVVFGKYFYT